MVPCLCHDQSSRSRSLTIPTSKSCADRATNIKMYFHHPHKGLDIHTTAFKIKMEQGLAAHQQGMVKVVPKDLHAAFEQRITASSNFTVSCVTGQGLLKACCVAILAPPKHQLRFSSLNYCQTGTRKTKNLMLHSNIMRSRCRSLRNLPAYSASETMPV